MVVAAGLRFFSWAVEFCEIGIRRHHEGLGMKLLPLAPSGIEERAGLERGAEQRAGHEAAIHLKKSAARVAVAQGHDPVIEAVEIELARTPLEAAGIPNAR